MLTVGRATVPPQVIQLRQLLKQNSALVLLYETVVVEVGVARVVHGLGYVAHVDHVTEVVHSRVVEVEELHNERIDGPVLDVVGKLAVIQVFVGRGELACDHGVGTL